MQNLLSTQLLTQVADRTAVLCLGRYTLAVRFRLRGPAVECRVPTWSGVGDLLADAGEAGLVALLGTGPHLRWLFLRGPAATVADPDWTDLAPLTAGQVDMSDLYELVRIEPKRIELVDEGRGWGVRETTDL